MARIILVALLFLSIVPGTSPASPPARAECDYAEAWADLGNWEKAVSHYQKALDFDPQNVSARLGLAHGLHNLGKKKQARKIIEALDRLESMPSAQLSALGMIQLQMQQPDQACRSFSRVLKRQPGHEQALFGTGRCHRAVYQNSPKDLRRQLAVEAFRQYLKRFPDGRYAVPARDALNVLIYQADGKTLARAREAYSTGDFHLAEKLLTRLTKKRPGLQEAHYLLGLTLAHPQIGKTGLAEKSLKKAGDLKEALLQRGILAFERDDLALAGHLLKRALKRDPAYARAHYYLGLVYRDQLKDKLAKKAFRRVTHLSPGSALAERAGSKLQILSGDVQQLPEGEVIDTASQIELGRKLSERVEKRFGLHQDQKTQQRLNRILRRVVARVDGLPLAVPYRVKVLDVEGVNALSFIDGTIYLFRGLTDFIQNEMNDSEDVYAAVLGHEVVHVVMRHGLSMLDLKGGGQALTQGSSFDVRGLQLLMQGLSRIQEYQADQLGSLYAYRAGFDPAASLRFHRRLIMSGREVPGHLDHPTHAQRADRLREYLLGLRSKVRHFDAGLKALEADDYQSSILHFEIFLGFFPASLSARNNLGVAMHRLAQGRSEDAREYKLSTDIDPDRRVRPIRLREKGTGFDRALMIEATEIFRTTARLAPDYLPAQNNLGACLLALGQREPARRTFEKISIKSKNSIQARSNLAVLDLLDGKLDRGIGILAAITQEKPDFADAHFNLGRAYMKSGKPKLARKRFTTYLALDRESGWARLAKKHLKKLGNP